jgi:hypothetical protein
VRKQRLTDKIFQPRIDRYEVSAGCPGGRNKTTDPDGFGVQMKKDAQTGFGEVPPE